MKRTVFVILLGALSLTACGSGTANPTPTVTPTAPLGPARAHFSVVGDAGLAGALTQGSITCALPSLNGLSIGDFAQPSEQAVLAYITMRQGFVNVRLAAGSGPQYTERDFSGTGVTYFDAAQGAQIESTLSETTQSSQAKGTIGAITSISGAVDCGNQQPGSGNVSVTGETADGTMSGLLSPIHVGCSNSPSSGSRAIIMGLTHVGSATVLVEIGAGTGTPALFISEQLNSGSHMYQSSTPGAATFSPGHVGVHGTAVESVTAGAQPHQLTVSGDAICAT